MFEVFCRQVHDFCFVVNYVYTNTFNLFVSIDELGVIPDKAQACLRLFRLDCEFYNNVKSI